MVSQVLQSSQSNVWNQLRRQIQLSAELLDHKSQFQKLWTDTVGYNGLITPFSTEITLVSRLYGLSYTTGMSYTTGIGKGIVLPIL